MATINLENGTYSYTASKSNYYEVTGNFTVEDDAENIDITIIGLGVDEESNVNLTLFPNPFDGSISFETTQMVEKVEIINLLGQKVISATNLNATGVIDASKLPSGIYIIYFSFKNGNSVQQKIVKK